MDFLLCRTYSKSGTVQDEAFCVRPTVWRLNSFFTEQLTQLDRHCDERGGTLSNKDIRAFLSQLTEKLKAALQKLRATIKSDEVVELALSCIHNTFRSKLRWDIKSRKPISQPMPSPSEGLESLSLFDFLGPSFDSDSSSASGKSVISLSDFLPAVKYCRTVNKLKPKPCKFHLINFYGSGCTRENCRFSHDKEEEQTKQICSRVTCRKRFYARHAKGLTKQEWYRAPRFFCYDHLERPSKLYKPGRLVSHTTLTRKKGPKFPVKKVSSNSKKKVFSRKSNTKPKNLYSALRN